MTEDKSLWDTFQKLATIIEQDSTDNTFKYALLRATSEVCQDYKHLLKVQEDLVEVPIGLIVEKWVLYYWPLFEYKPLIPQMPERYHGEKRLQLQFRKQLDEIIQYYQKGNGVSEFYNDYINDKIPLEIDRKLLSLLKKIRYLIQRYPMKHLGYSVYKDHYQVYKPNLPLPQPRETVTRKLLVEEFGSFTINRDYYEAFNKLGGYIIGDQSIFTQWAKLTEKFTNKEPGFGEIQGLLMMQPITQRQVEKVKNMYTDKISTSTINCVWSGKPINETSDLNIDHMLPFSKLRNNDLWNLVPSKTDVNGRKSDRIPSTKLLKKRKPAIINHWMKLMERYPTQFTSEAKYSLIGYGAESEDLDNLFTALTCKTEYLVNERHYREWNG